MNLSSDLHLVLSETEIRSLWIHLDARRADLDGPLDAVLKRVESVLWDRMTIETLSEVADG